jgi:hypothetical protein
MSRSPFRPDTLQRVRDSVQPGQTIRTLSRAMPNRIVAIDPEGILVDTERSKGSAQLVPAWMIEVAWDQLRRQGTLTNAQLLNELGVKRSSFVCALLTHFDDVEVASERPIRLEHRPSSARQG